MKAVELYVDAFSAILAVEKSEVAERWGEIHKLLLLLKDEISCTCCKRLLSNSMKSQSNCGHYVCKPCIPALELTPSSCDECSNGSVQFVPNEEMDTLIRCYKKMCEYTVNSKAYRNLSMNGCKTIKIDNIEESSADTNGNADGASNGSDTNAENDGVENNIEDDDLSSKSQLISTEINDGVDFVNSCLKFRKTSTFPTLIHKNGVSLEEKTVIMKEPTDKPKVGIRFAKSKPSGCKCGLATAVPGKLTCCGQRCPCYVSSKQCISCKCRGCRNPQNRKTPKQNPQLAANHFLVSVSKENDGKDSDESSDVDVDN